MSFQPSFPGLFAPAPPPVASTPMVEPVAATAKQVTYAQALSKKLGTDLPAALLQDRRALSQWIDAHRPAPVEGRFAQYPSSKQVAFAERIARLKRSPVPDECFRDKTLMSRWIDSNKPR